VELNIQQMNALIRDKASEAAKRFLMHSHAEPSFSCRISSAERNWPVCSTWCTSSTT
jgi:hypothetical protein